MNGLPVDHVAVAIPDLAEAIPLYERLTGARSSPVEDIPSQGVRVAFVGGVELLEPLSPASTVARFLERNGPGLHHIAYRTDDIRSELARLSRTGFQLIDAEPRPGAGGHLVAFLHPRSTGGVLVELVQHTP
ncbi:MAG TPA: methylmalonyl-CoA epimerase [Longimicrobiales bacterium]|nr:methylmalonyl-CoA epimerase [Longimicrobiales bacterium]